MCRSYILRFSIVLGVGLVLLARGGRVLSRQDEGQKPAEKVSEPAKKSAEKPADKPADKPAEKPAEEKPAEKPGEKPAEKPEEKPAAKPAEEKPSEKPGEKPTEKPTEKPEQPKPVGARPEQPSVDFPGAGLFNDQPPFLVGVKVNHKDLSYEEGEKLAAEFTAEREAHLYLIYHQADGKSLLLFPNEARRENRIAAKQPVIIPPPGQDFRFRIGPPFGTEVLQVIASLKPLEELDGLVQKTGRAPIVSGEVIEKLKERLSKDLASWTEHRVIIRTTAKESLPPPRKAARVGLFIGVNKYQNEKLCTPAERFRLGAELLAKTFVERGGVEAQNVKTIVAEQATRANIEEAIVKWLPSVSQPGDTVFILYAGHGTTIKNLDGSKPDGRDGLISTYDNNPGENIKSQEEFEAALRKQLISDEALARWLEELNGRQIVLMLETCHAGSMIDARTLSRFFIREAAAVKGIAQLNVNMVVACAPDESGYNNPDRAALMPLYIAEAMENLPKPVTLAQAFAHYLAGQKRFLEEISKKADVPLVGQQQPMLIDTSLLPIVLAP